MPPATVALATPPPPGLAEATKNSLSAWQHHLAELFRAAKDRFPDVVWELTAEDDDEKVIDEVWGHKAIVYARAPPSFQSRYFSFRPHPVSSPTPYSHSPTGNPSQSALSLTYPSGGSPSPSPLPHRASSPSTLPPNTSLLRITSSINPALFSNELEYLYTGQGFGEAFEFLFDSADAQDPDHEVDPEDLRVDKLRKDLVFMWRSRLYSDVRISLSGNFSSTSHESTTAIFSSHRFILVSRSPYFYDALLSWPLKSSKEEIPTLTLPSPPFTPPSLHFTLGFIYTGTLVFSHRTYDLSTAFAILRAALYLSLSSLHDEIQARIAHEMLHGLFHAFLPFQEYERLTQSKWGTGGCRCRQCARRVPRVLEFSLEEDVKNSHLERGARRALVGLFGEGWCTQEFATLNPKLRESLLKGVAKRTTPQNVFPLLFAAEHAIQKLSTIIDSWADTVREMILNGRKHIDEVICKESEAAFSSDDWMEIMEGDGTRFDDSERVEWVMAAVMRGVKEPWAASLYQTLVSSILIKPHPTEPNAPFLSSTSQVRQQVEQTRIELCKWMGKRWLQIRQEHGFDGLEGWAIKELSDYMEVPIDDLLSRTTAPTRGSPRNKHPTNRISSHPHTSRIDADSEAASSMRVSVLSRNLAASRRTGGGGTSSSARDNASVHSSASSIRSSARSTLSTSSAASDSTIGRSSSRGGGETVNNGMSPARRIVQATRERDAAKATVDKERPDSKLTPSAPSVGSRETSPTPQPSLRLPPEDDEEQKSVSGDADVVGGEGDEDDGASVASEAPTEPDSPSLSTPTKKLVVPRTPLATVPSRSPGSSNRPISPRNKTSPSSTSIRSQPRKTTVSITSRHSQAARSVATSLTTSSRPVSRSSTRTSSASTLSRVSTARSSTASTTTTTTTSSASVSRPVSAVSTTSGASARQSTVSTADSTGTYKTASSGLSTPHAPRSRKSSAASTASARTAGRLTPSPSPFRLRALTASSSAYGTAKSSVSKTTPHHAHAHAPPVPAIDPTKLSPVAAAKVKSSGTSVRSVRSTSSIKSRGGGVPSVIRTSTSASGATGRKGVVVGKGSATSPGSSAPVSPIQTKASVSLPAEENKENEGGSNVRDEMKVDEPGKEEEEELKNTPSSITIKPGMMLVESDVNTNTEHKKTDSTNSTGSNSTITVRKKRSNETITNVETATMTTPSRGSRGSRSSGGSSADNKARNLDKPQPPLPPPPTATIQPSVDESSELSYSDAPLGATLEIGIPCIVSSKRKRFKAYARYIGEVQGEYGPWVGVEVPIPLGESWADRDMPDSGWQGTQWNDGTWGGIRYFDVGGSGGGGGHGKGGDWDYSYGDDSRASRRRRLDAGSTTGSWSTVTRGGGGVKREGEQLAGTGGMRKRSRMRSVSPAVSDASEMESRGLFVRPQQVLYVVDAVEDL
ncbi:hypothetical protein D9756_010219 [Leucocoprinus leucothites]|uniref:BTB domain-containing protein n=1 Tax=Leucocoprinus leucothites TaxID=201217 RepID=A0A8H5CVS5_9AGAR|nr:hypothetical protein D9756_010219 [Leucoagaricus leucothites]